MNWIRCKDRQAPMEKKLLVVFDGVIYFGWRVTPTWWHLQGLGRQVSGRLVTHWAPLPALPGQDKSVIVEDMAGANVG